MSDNQDTAQSMDIIYVPDLGGSESEVIEIFLKSGDFVKKDQSVITLESDKASMEIPCPKAGTVATLFIKMGDRVKTGDKLLSLLRTDLQKKNHDHQEFSNQQTQTKNPTLIAISTSDQNFLSAKQPGYLTENPTLEPPNLTESNHLSPTSNQSQQAHPHDLELSDNESTVHAGPAVRLFARELGVSLHLLKGTGPKNRVLKTDVQQFVKDNSDWNTTQQANSGSWQKKQSTSSNFNTTPTPDFSSYGPTTQEPLSRIQQLTATNLHQSWVNIPHVTHFDAADITDLESFRISLKPKADALHIKLTLLPFLLKTCAHALKTFPNFNSSLTNDGQSRILKTYINIGFAVDTPDGLYVPVIKNVEHKNIWDLAKEAATLAQKARDKKITPKDMQGSCFTITSLGHIGGTGFTPIINPPEVAILGINQAKLQPVWQKDNFVPRLLLPLSLSYDHRAINGVEAAKFTQLLSHLLADIRQLLMGGM